jgi:D-galactarolactone cycloisomerase
VISRRAALGGLLAGLATPGLAQGIYARRGRDGRLRFPEATPPPPPVDFERWISRPVTIRSVELWRTKAGTDIVRVLSADGVEGVVRASTKSEHTVELFKAFAVPRFEGKDARDLPDLIRRAAREDYEYASVPYWSAIGQAEVAIWDLLGKVAKRRCADFIGPVLRDTIPVYMSSNKRDTTPEAEIAHLAERVAETGAKAVKLKIGRRMGFNTDMTPGRSEAVIALARKTLGDGMTIYADANGAYDSVKALEVAAMLEDHGVALFEEPCPFEDFEMTRDVARGIRRRRYRLKTASGENDSALEKWRWLAENRAVDVIQPDPMYAGGIIRNLEIMRMGRAAGLAYNPHFPRNGADTAPLLHLCAVAPNLWGFQEYRSRPDPLDFAHTPLLEPRGGVLPLPAGPGWGISYDPSIWRQATRM